MEKTDFKKAEPGSLWTISPTYLGGLYFHVYDTDLITLSPKEYHRAFNTCVDQYEPKESDVIFKVGDVLTEPHSWTWEVNAKDKKYHHHSFYKVLVTTNEDEVIEGWLHDFATEQLKRIDG